MNIVQSCLDRHRDREFHDKVALIWEGEPGEVRKLCRGEPTAKDLPPGRRAEGGLGCASATCVGIFMPMCPRSPSPCFRGQGGSRHRPDLLGHGAKAIATRLQDGGGEGAHLRRRLSPARPGRPNERDRQPHPRQRPTVTKVIVHRHVVREIPWTHGRWPGVGGAARKTSPATRPRTSWTPRTRI